MCRAASQAGCKQSGRSGARLMPQGFESPGKSLRQGLGPRGQMLQKLSKSSCWKKIPTLRIPVATSIPASWGGGRQCGVCAAHVCVTAVCLWDALCVRLCGCLCVFVCALFGDTCSTLLLLDLGSQSHSSLTAG